MPHANLAEFRTFFAASQALVDALDSLQSPEKPVRFVDDVDEFYEYKEFRVEAITVNESLSFDDPQDVDDMSLEDLTHYVIQRMEPLILLSGGLSPEIPQILLGRSTVLSAPTYHGVVAALMQVSQGSKHPLPIRWSQLRHIRLLRTAIIRERLLIVGVAQQRFPASSLADPDRNQRRVTVSKLDLERLEFKQENKGLSDKQLAKKYREFKGKKCSTRAFTQSCYRARLASNKKITSSQPLPNRVDE